MKARNLFSVLVILIGLSTTAMARTPEEVAMKKCCKQLNKELRKSLRGPSFDYLKPDCCETLVVKFRVDKDNKLIFHKIVGEDEELMKYVENTLKDKEFYAVNSSLQGKMVRFPVNFQHVE
ncbi:hypothetical protein [Carboxylicivirga marina]|uniref:TonB C-terminal domain-containing protein n=1 Tax=Carboxylicivirga marina TaxID=2800988 RepID=A0ABS1HLS3_9BACT|nr:hypothetical protein [Carboxylicivirga marina]MBK3518643.1 hypothetical protein [Carboxylicivirga marina]